MIGLTRLLSADVIERLGWTLLHSLWQGAAAAVLFGLLLLLIPPTRPNGRYVAGCLLLLTMFAMSATTFLAADVSPPVPETGPVMAVEPEPMTPLPTPGRLPEPTEPNRVVVVPTDHVAPAVEKPRAEPAPVMGIQPNSAPAEPWHQQFTRSTEPFLPWVVLGWLLGVAVLSIWRLGGWIATRRLRAIGTRPVSRDITVLAHRLSERLRVGRPVRILQSIVIRTPAVIGHFRPVVLLPIGALTGLTTEQLEAIIAHELAHIRRRDYLIRILQTVIETLLFYHPAVWWISRRIDQEREHCCDDLAVAACGSRLGYAGALSALEGLRSTAPSLAAAASGGSLVRRIHRLLDISTSGPGQTRRALTGIYALAVVLSLGVGIGIRVLASEAREKASTVAAANEASDDTEGMPESPPAELLGPVPRHVNANRVEDKLEFDKRIVLRFPHATGPYGDYRIPRASDDTPSIVFSNHEGQIHGRLRMDIPPGGMQTWWMRVELLDDAGRLVVADEQEFTNTDDRAQWISMPIYVIRTFAFDLGPSKKRTAVTRFAVVLEELFRGDAGKFTSQPGKRVSRQQPFKLNPQMIVFDLADPGVSIARLIVFKHEQNRLRGEMYVSYPSGPKAAWKVVVGLLDKAGETTGERGIRIENGGLIHGGLVFARAKILEFDFGQRKDISDIISVTVSVEQLPLDGDSGAEAPATQKAIGGAPDVPSPARLLAMLKATDALYRQGFTATGTAVFGSPRTRYEWKLVLDGERSALRQVAVEILDEKENKPFEEPEGYPSGMSGIRLLPNVVIESDVVGTRDSTAILTFQKRPRVVLTDKSGRRNITFWGINPARYGASGPLRVLGRGLSDGVERIVRVERNPDGTLLAAVNLINGWGSCTLHIDPAADYLIRSSKGVVMEFSNSGLRWLGNRCIPLEGEWEQSGGQATLTIETASLESDRELLERVEAMMHGPYPWPAEVVDARFWPPMATQCEANEPVILGPLQPGHPDSKKELKERRVAPRQTAEAFLRAFLAGDEEKARSLVASGFEVAKQFPALRELISNRRELSVEDFCFTGDRAIVITSVVPARSDPSLKSPVLLRVVKDQERWLIDRIDFDLTTAFTRRLTNLRGAPDRTEQPNTESAAGREATDKKPAVPSPAELLAKLKATDALYRQGFTAEGTSVHGWPKTRHEWRLSMGNRQVALLQKAVKILDQNENRAHPLLEDNRIGRIALPQVKTEEAVFVDPEYTAWLFCIAKPPVDLAQPGGFRNINFMSETSPFYVREVLWAMGRGFSGHIQEITDVSPHEDGKLKAVVTTNMGLNPCELIIEPAADYMIRWAKVSYAYEFSNSGRQRIGNRCVPTSATWARGSDGRTGRAEVVFERASVEVDHELLDKVEKMMHAPYSTTTTVSEDRAWPGLGAARVRPGQSVVRIGCTAVSHPDAQKEFEAKQLGPRRAVEQFLAAFLKDDEEAANALIARGSAAFRQLAELRKAVGDVDKLGVRCVRFAGERAVLLTDDLSLESDPSLKAPVFLRLAQDDGQWLIQRIDAHLEEPFTRRITNLLSAADRTEQPTTESAPARREATNSVPEVPSPAELLARLKATDALYRQGFTAEGTSVHGWPKTRHEWRLTMGNGELAFREHAVEILDQEANKPYLEDDIIDGAAIRPIVEIERALFANSEYCALSLFVEPPPSELDGKRGCRSVYFESSTPTAWVGPKLWVLGRGITKHIQRITDVSRRPDGTLAITAVMSDVVGDTWKFHIDPQADYMVRWAKGFANEFSTTGFRRIGPRCIPLKASWKGNGLEATVAFRSASSQIDRELLHAVEALICPPFQDGGIPVEDLRVSPHLVTRYPSDQVVVSIGYVRPGGPEDDEQLAQKSAGPRRAAETFLDNFPAGREESAMASIAPGLPALRQLVLLREVTDGATKLSAKSVHFARADKAIVLTMDVPVGSNPDLQTSVILALAHHDQRWRVERIDAQLEEPFTRRLTRLLSE